MRRFTVAAWPDLKPKKVAILGFEAASALELGGPLETLVATRADVSGGKTSACYSVRVIGVTGKSFSFESGFVGLADDVLRKTAALDTVIIPGGSGIRVPDVTRKIADWLLAHATAIRRIVAINAGIYPLAQSGLLDGRAVTTHWKLAQDVAHRFPTVRVDRTLLSARDGAFYTCGSATAALELILTFIEEDYGKWIALSVAREFLLRLRPITDMESATPPMPSDYSPADRMADLPAWINAHLDENLSVEALAERACLCPRHFRRLFKQSFKITPAAFVEHVRIAEANRRLLLPQNNIENVAAAVGFKTSDSFRRAFQRRQGVSPRAYRRSLKIRRPETPSPGLFVA